MSYLDTALIRGAFLSERFLTGMCSGFLGVTAVMAGGKLWTSMNNPHQKVSNLLGTIGTPEFRRQAAVGLGVQSITSSIFYMLVKDIEEKLGSNTNASNIKNRIKTVIILALSGALGVVAAAATTHENYRKTQYVAIASAVIFFGGAGVNKMK
jgi:spore maturation protein SpmB